MVDLSRMKLTSHSTVDKQSFIGTSLEPSIELIVAKKLHPMAFSDFPSSSPSLVREFYSTAQISEEGDQISCVIGNKPLVINEHFIALSTTLSNSGEKLPYTVWNHPRANLEKAKLWRAYYFEPDADQAEMEERYDEAESHGRAFWKSEFKRTNLKPQAYFLAGVLNHVYLDRGGSDSSASFEVMKLVEMIESESIRVIDWAAVFFLKLKECVRVSKKGLRLGRLITAVINYQLDSGEKFTDMEVCPSLKYASFSAYIQPFLPGQSRKREKGKRKTSFVPKSKKLKIVYTAAVTRPEVNQEPVPLTSITSTCGLVSNLSVVEPSFVDSTCVSVSKNTLSVISHMNDREAIPQPELVASPSSSDLPFQSEPESFPSPSAMPPIGLVSEEFIREEEIFVFRKVKAMQSYLTKHREAKIKGSQLSLASLEEAYNDCYKDACTQVSNTIANNDPDLIAFAALPTISKLKKYDDLISEFILGMFEEIRKSSISTLSQIAAAKIPLEKKEMELRAHNDSLEKDKAFLTELNTSLQQRLRLKIVQLEEKDAMIQNLESSAQGFSTIQTKLEKEIGLKGVNTLLKKPSRFESYIACLESQNKELASEVDKKDIRLAELNGLMEDASARIDENKVEISTLQVEKSSLNDVVVAQKEEIELLRAKLASLAAKPSSDERQPTSYNADCLDSNEQDVPQPEVLPQDEFNNLQQAIPSRNPQVDNSAPSIPSSIPEMQTEIGKLWDAFHSQQLLYTKLKDVVNLIHGAIVKIPQEELDCPSLQHLVETVTRMMFKN